MFFFFKQKTAYEMRISDWSSDVCSSDLSMDALGRSDRSSGSLKGRRSVVSRGKYPRDVIEIVMTGLLSVNSNLPFSSVFVPAPVPAIFTVAPGSGTPSSAERTVPVTVSWAKVGRTQIGRAHV